MPRILTKLTVPLLAAAMLSPLSALAEGYLGFGGGISSYTIDDDEEANGGKIFAGYRVWEGYGLEAGYIYFGEFDVTGTPAGNSVETNGAYAALSGFTTVGTNIELTGKLGALYYDQDVNVGGNTVRTPDGVSPILGVGMNFLLNETVSLGLEFTHVNNVEEEDINSLWLNIAFRLAGGY